MILSHLSKRKADRAPAAKWLTRVAKLRCHKRKGRPESERHTNGKYLLAMPFDGMQHGHPYLFP